MSIKIALIESGEIATVSLQNPERPYPPGNWMPLEQALELGYTYKSNTPSVPEEIPLWAFRSAIALNGLLDQVVAMIKELPEPQKTVAWQQWEYANWISRNHETVDEIASALGLTPSQVDDIFRLGDSLT